MRRNKIRVVVFLTVAVVAIILLGAGLTRLQLLPGQPFSLRGGEEAEGAEEPAAGEQIDFWTISNLFAVILIWATPPLLILYFIFARKDRRMLSIILLTLLWGLVFYYVRYVALRNLMTEPPGGQWSEQIPAETTPLPVVEFKAEAPDWLAYAVSLGLAMLFAGVVMLFWRRRSRSRRSLQVLAQEAQGALDEIEAGGEWKHAVLRCYAEMCRVLGRQRGLKRQKGMTPSEFAVYLEAAGLPGRYVQRLTRLFELVRYGEKDTGTREELEAVDCLKAIVRACEAQP